MERALPLEELASAGLERRSRFDFTLDVLLSYPDPNYDNPVTRGPELYVLNSIFFAFMLFCVAVRLYSRIFIRKWFGWDDFFIVLAVVWAFLSSLHNECSKYIQVGATGVTACVMLGTRKYAWDRHIYDIRLHLIQRECKKVKIVEPYLMHEQRLDKSCLLPRSFGL